MPPLTGLLVSRRLATLRELENYYSYGDALDMAEILRVDNHNERVIMDAARR